MSMHIIIIIRYICDIIYELTYYDNQSKRPYVGYQLYVYLETLPSFMIFTLISQLQKSSMYILGYKYKTIYLI